MDCKIATAVGFRLRKLLGRARACLHQSDGGLRDWRPSAKHLALDVGSKSR